MAVRLSATAIEDGQMVQLRILRMAGCGPKCRLDADYDVRKIAHVIGHTTERAHAAVDVDHLDESTQERLAEWIKAQHAAESAFYGGT